MTHFFFFLVLSKDDIKIQLTTQERKCLNSRKNNERKPSHCKLHLTCQKGFVRGKLKLFLGTLRISSKVNF